MVIETHNGVLFDFDDPRPEQVHLEDIAHALAHTCRFGGHCRKFYSVAEHAVLVSRLCPRDVALEALHHDDHEAYLGDIPTPLKRTLGEALAGLADDIDRAIVAAFDLDWPRLESQAVHDADRVALRLEAAVLKTSRGTGPHWGYDEPLTHERLGAVGYPPALAKQFYLARHRELSR